MGTISKEQPLAELTLRKYEKPGNLTDRELVKKLCLSLGLLQAGDSRDVIVDVFMVLLSRKQLSSESIEQKVVEQRTSLKLPLIGIAGSNIRRQLLRLREAFLVEKVANEYRIAENAKLADLFTEKIERYVLPSILGRIREYLTEADERFKG
ncbi:MAG: hypothetical protein V1725_04075 [archaeon]